jgi:hypothetical protein
VAFGFSSVSPRERTHDDFPEKLVRYVRPQVVGVKLSDLLPPDVESICSMPQRELSPRAIRNTHAILSSAFNQAVKWNMLSRTPCGVVELPRMVRKEMQALTPEGLDSSSLRQRKMNTTHCSRLRLQRE